MVRPPAGRLADTIMETRRLIFTTPDDTLAQFLEQAVSLKGYEFARATDVLEAYRLLREKGCSALILEHQLPRLEGGSFARLLKNNLHWKAIPVVLIVQNEEEKRRLSEMDTGADAYLVKPFDLPSFFQILDLLPPSPVLPTASAEEFPYGLLQEMQAQLDASLQQMRTYGKFVGSLTTVQSVEALAEAALLHFTRLTSAERLFFFRFSSDLKELLPVACRGFSPGLFSSLHIPFQEGRLLSTAVLNPEGKCVQGSELPPEGIFESIVHPTKEGIAIPVDLTAKIPCRTPEVCGTPRCCALQFLPERTLVHVGFSKIYEADFIRCSMRKVFGVVYMDNPESNRSFLPVQLQVITTFIRQVALSMENLYTTESFHKRITEVSILHHTSQLVSSTLDLQKTLNSIILAVTDGLKTRRGSVMLLDDDGYLKVKASAGMSPEAAREAKLHPGEGIAGWVFQNKKPLLIRDVQSDPLFQRLANPQYLTRSAIIVPLEVDDEIIGVINVSDKIDGTPFDERDQSLLQSIAHHAVIALKNAKLYNELRDSYLETVRALAEAIEAKDPYTRGHSERVARYTTLIAREMGISSQLLELLNIAGILHDVGKIGVRESVLLKPDRLTEEEFTEIKKHAVQGDIICSPIKFLQPVRSAIRSHHEWYAGGGYPDGLRGEEIPLIARIMALADAFDAMTTERKYRPALPLQEAVRRIREAEGIQFDPRVVEAFERLVKSGHLPPPSRLAAS